MRWCAGVVGSLVLLFGAAVPAAADVRPEARTTGGARFGPEVIADVEDLYSTSAAAVGDVTGDGVDDLVAASYGRDGRLLVFEWDGDGLRLVTDTPTSGYPLHTMAIGDVLGAAGQEILVGYQGSLRIYRTDTGSPVLAEERSVGAYGLDVGDVDDDGRDDVVTSPVNDPEVLVHLQQSDGTLAAATAVPLGFESNRDVELGDLDDDGRLDIVAMAMGDATISVLYQRDEGFSTPEVHALSPTGWSAAIAVGDLTGDGRDDVALVRDGGIHLFAQQAEGGLAETRVLQGYPSPRGMATVDVDGDGDLDLVTDSSYSSVVTVHHQEAGGLDPQFQRYQLTTSSAAPASSPAFGDVTGDGRIDLAGPTSGSAEQDGVVALLPSTGATRRWPASAATDVGASRRAAVDWAAFADVMGTPDERRFRPAAAVTRVQLAHALWRAAGRPYAERRLPDVPRWARTAVAYLLEGRVDHYGQPRPAPMSTYPDGTFRPNRPVTRAQAALTVYRQHGQDDVADPDRAHHYVDVPPWAEDAVRWLTTSRTGYDDQRPYAPGIDPVRFGSPRVLSRGDFATWLYRISG